MCAECLAHLMPSKGSSKKPPAALTNDLMICCAPKEIYEHRATVLEMICASTCLTSMLCFSLEKKYRGKRLYDAEALNQEHRIAARGECDIIPITLG